MLLGAIFVPTDRLAIERSNRIQCASNLRRLGMAANAYAQGQRSLTFPRTYYNVDSTTVTVYSGAKGDASFAVQRGQPSPVGDNNVTASLYLLAKSENLAPQVFLCPSSDATAWDFVVRGTAIDDYCDFPSRKYLSYSYACPFPSKNAVLAGFRFSALRPRNIGDLPLAADMNPGTPALLTASPTGRRTRAINSTNHDGDGQNVAYLDGHVEWTITPFCGAARGTGGARDNIYTCGNPAGSPPTPLAISGQPQDADDMVLLPVMADGVQPPHVVHLLAFGDRATIAIGGVGLLVMFAMAAALLYSMRERKPPAAVSADSRPIAGGPSFKQAHPAPAARPSGGARPPPVPPFRPRDR